MSQPPLTMPLVAPALRLPPYSYNHIRRVSVVLEAPPEAVQQFIPEPLEYVTNKFVVWIEHRVDQQPSPAPDWFRQPFDTYEASLDIPCRFRGQEGTHIPLMWVPTSEADFARALAGRELQGIGKTMAHFYWEERIIDNEVVARLVRNGIDVVNLHIRLNGTGVNLPTKPPVIGIKTFPRIDGKGYDLRKVVALENWNVNAVQSRGAEVLSVQFGVSEADPLYRLKPTANHGALFTVWNGSTETPCGHELADLLDEAQ